MTSYDAVLDDLADRIRKLSTRALAGLFWACATALVPAAEAWARHRGEQIDRPLQQGLWVARQFAASGAGPRDPGQLLEALELFGVSQVGGGDQEEAEIRTIVAHPRVAGAIGFCRWASDFLYQRPSPGEDDLATVARAAAALTP
jgi:hypothetical protein